MPRAEAAFAFKSDLTPQANVEAFLEYMAGEYKEFAELLRDNLEIVIGAAERDRSEARKRFNRRIAEALDAPPGRQEVDPS